jgi:ABC-2 type transport system ATP-binding protein
MLQGRIHGMSGAPLRARVDELLELVGLADAAERVTRGYSGGMKRRLDIAIGLVHRPRILFLDEPTTGLDPEARAGMWVEVERLAAQESLTIVLTTHYLEEADRLAQRVAIVSRGRIVVEGEPEELKRGLQGESVSVELRDVDGRLADAERVVAEISGNVHVEGSLVRARVPNGAQAIPVILGALDDAGVDVAAVTTARPSLDDVYLHYTGRDFAREDEEGR